MSIVNKNINRNDHKHIPLHVIRFISHINALQYQQCSMALTHFRAIFWHICNDWQILYIPSCIISSDSLGNVS
jgi:hypothetical protein